MFALQGGPLNLEMHGLAYLTHSSQLPGAVLYTDGEVSRIRVEGSRVRVLGLAMAWL